jgi:hypothetical protein
MPNRWKRCTCPLLQSPNFVPAWQCCQQGGGWIEEGKSYQDSRKLKSLCDFWEAFFAKSGAQLEGFGVPSY